MAGELKKMVLTLLLISVVLTGAAAFYGGVADAYTPTDSIDDVSEFSAQTEAQGLSTRMRDSVTEAQLTNIEAIDIPFMVISGGYNALMLVLDSIMYFISLVSDLIVFTGLPIGWVEGIIAAVISVVIVFAVLSALVKWEL